ncbi:thiamine pyrophosphate-dependent enzyme [Flavonifractor plautii]|nr:thiamine pyrophosphate-dependent enzyme [Flavonifractor plautii]
MRPVLPLLPPRPVHHLRRLRHHGLRPGGRHGAAVGNPGKVVVHCTGDGCFRMNCHELCTAEHYNIPVITVIFNNRTLGMVRQWQNLIYQKRFSQTDLDRGPDFVKLAEAYGIQGSGPPPSRSSRRPSAGPWPRVALPHRVRHRQGRHGPPHGLRLALRLPISSWIKGGRGYE